MTITGIMMTWIFFLRKNINRMCIAGLITLIDIVFLTSNMFKIPHGGYWSLIIASLPLAIILIYTNGQKRLYQALKPIPIEKFLEEYIPSYNEFYRIRGTALYLIRDAKNIPPYITNTMFCNKIIYQNNILISASILDEAFGVKTIFTGTITEGLQVLEIQIGYMEVIDMETILREAGIEENVIFYGLEDIFTDNPIWKVFAFIKKITPSFVQFYSLPSNKLHGIITRVEI
jgi:KUP system potassium uptake protein